MKQRHKFTNYKYRQREEKKNACWYKIMEVRIMKKYVCEPCGYVYDPEVGDPDNGIAPGTAFEDIPEDWVCPICGVDKSLFVEE